ncbi:merozoite surface protein 7 [Plasmodium gonderi]|uniref:Merozoite surface protein 7 n=1 Tax=Plasmodium gonderi TaxID=77519 RepID=A0A1Y1JKP7_PLAGO|nr:merozoite surface protein 7 [Plasmodium gonderi]GAW82218.1 merozoite surface protein 7 [Plasmodium gonderi]
MNKKVNLLYIYFLCFFSLLLQLTWCEEKSDNVQNIFNNEHNEPTESGRKIRKLNEIIEDDISDEYHNENDKLKNYENGHADENSDDTFHHEPEEMSSDENEIKSDHQESDPEKQDQTVFGQDGSEVALRGESGQADATSSEKAPEKVEEAGQSPPSAAPGGQAEAGETSTGAGGGGSTVGNSDGNSQGNTQQVSPQPAVASGEQESSPKTQPEPAREAGVSADASEGRTENPGVTPVAAGVVQSDQPVEPAVVTTAPVAVTGGGSEAKIKYLDKLYDEVLTTSDNRSGINAPDYHSKYNTIKTKYELSMNPVEYEIVKNMFNAGFKKEDDMNTNPLVDIFKKVLTEEKFQNEFDNFVSGLYGFAKRHNYLSEERMKNGGQGYTDLIKNALTLLNTIVVE